VIARSPHPDIATLTDLAEGRLSGDVAARARAHLAACARCAAEVATLERLIGTMRADQGEDAPAAVIARAARLFRPLVQPAPPTLRERLLAALKFDSGVQPLALGLRTVAHAPRQLLFGVGDYDLDLQVTSAGEQWLLAGQLLGPASGGSITISGPAGAATAALNDQGEFSLPPLASGTYALRLTLDTTELDFPELRLGV
jgi:anti-sigma factor RsiW